MDRYDPSHEPNPEDWLALDEQQRIFLVEQYHRRSKIALPKETVHATIHVVVENQLALGDDPVVRALARLMKEGLSRHDALHAIGSVLTGNIYDSLKAEDSPETLQSRYYSEIERLTAARWREEYDG